jgi:hypothetical protein
VRDHRLRGYALNWARYAGVGIEPVGPVRGRHRGLMRADQSQTEFGRWLRKNLAPVIDTSTCSPAEVAMEVAAWVQDRIAEATAEIRDGNVRMGGSGLAGHNGHASSGGRRRPGQRRVQRRGRDSQPESPSKH